MDSGENVKKTKGRPIQNNAYLEGIIIKASKRILIGNEIFIEYSPCKESIHKNK